MAEEQRQNIQTKDDFILKKLKEIDEQNAKIEKLTAELENSKVKLEADFETERVSHTKETKVLNDRLEFATTQVKSIYDFRKINFQADWYRQNSHKALRKLGQFHEKFLAECRDTFNFDPKFEFDFDIGTQSTESQPESTKVIGSY